MNQCDGVELTTGQAGIDRPMIDMSAPFHLERLCVLAAASRYIEPFIGERTAHTTKHILADYIANGGFHHAPSR